MKYILLLFLFCTSCADLEYHQFNHEDDHEDDQDPNCYAHYGASQGYCDKVYTRQVK